MFSIKETIKCGWEKFKANAGVSVLTTLFVLAIGSLSWKDDRFHVGSLFFGLAVMVFMLIVRIGYTKIFLRMHDGEKPKFMEIFQEYKLFWKYLGVSILMPLTVLGGLILLIIPGIFWAVRFSFSPLIVVDAKIGPVVAMKRSYAITKGKFWKLLGFWVIIGLINLLGLIVIGVGLLVTVPVTILASVCVYRELSKVESGLDTTFPQSA